MKQQTIEGDFKIARFMGYTYESAESRVFKISHESLHNYSEDWNRIMPVCKKIVDMYKDRRRDIFEGLMKCDIGLTWQAVVEFIEFWNNPDSLILTWRNVDSNYNPKPAGRVQVHNKPA